MANVTIQDRNGNQLTVSQEAWNSVYSLAPNGKYSIVSTNAAPNQPQTPPVNQVQTPQAPTQQQTQQKQILSDNGRLYAWDGKSATYIPDQATLVRYVNQLGFKDTRAAYSSVVGNGQSRSTSPSQQTPSSQSSKQILSDNGRLYAWDGSSTTYIPDQATLQRFVSSGFQDTRAPIATASQQTQQTQQSTVNTPTAPVSTPTSPLGTGILDKTYVKFSSDPNGSLPGDQTTVWLVDPTTKSLRPFLNEEAFNAYAGPEAWNSINSFDPRELEAGSLKNYVLLGPDYGVESSGTIKNEDFNPSLLRQSYGKEQNDESTAEAIGVLKMIKNKMDSLSANGTLSGVNAQQLTTAWNDPVLLAKLINAVAYGGYGGQDVSQEVIKTALVKSGRTDLANVNVIDSTKSKTDYMKTDTYKTATSNPYLSIPKNVAEDLLLATTNTDYFQQGTLEDMLNSPDFKTKMDALRSTYHDIIDQQLSATTERDKQIAETNWNNYRDEVKKNLGITLENDASKAWNQLINLEKQASGAGLAGSGIFNETYDRYLQGIRKDNAVTRDVSTSTAEKEMQNYYLNFASAEEIQKLLEQDKASGLPESEWKSVKWGLRPNADVVSQFDVETMTKKMMEDYPGTPEWMARQQAEALRNSILDENGNIRSSIYSTYQQNKGKNELARLNYQQGRVQEESQIANDKLFAAYTPPDPTSVDYFSDQNRFETPLNQAKSSVDTSVADAAGKIADSVYKPTSTTSSTSTTSATTIDPSAKTKIFYPNSDSQMEVSTLDYNNYWSKRGWTNKAS